MRDSRLAAPPLTRMVSPVLNIIFVVLHVIVSILLIMFILLKSGKGGGLSDMFGGGSMSSAGGSTMAEKNLDRLTVITAVVFAMTTMILAIRLV